MTIIDWEVNIENAIANVAAKYGNAVVEAVFRRYNATCFENLSPVYYSDVFGDLMFLENDG